MPDGAQMNLRVTAGQSLGLADAINALKGSGFTGDLDVRVGEIVISCSAEDVASGAALQRLAGLSRLLSVTSEPPMSNVQALRLRKPVLHPGVAEILDALRQKG